MRVFTNKNRQRKNSAENLPPKNDPPKRKNSFESLKKVKSLLSETFKIRKKSKNCEDFGDYRQKSVYKSQNSNEFKNYWSNLWVLNGSILIIPNKRRYLSIEFIPVFLDTVEFLLYGGVKITIDNFRLYFNAMWSNLLVKTFRQIFSQSKIVIPVAKNVSGKVSDAVSVPKEYEEIEQQEITIVGKGRKLPPNYFVALQIKNEEIIENIKQVQSQLITKQPLLKPALIPIETMHITLMVMHLDEEHCLHDAKKALQLTIEEASRTGFNDVSLEFDGMGTFKNGDVIFASLAKNDGQQRLEKFTELTKNCFKKCGIISTDSNRSFTPHLTIAKMNNSRLYKKGIKKIRSEWYAEFESTNFGREIVNSVQLLSMLKPKNANDGYYHCVKELNLK